MSFDNNTVVWASAGTGKTHKLVEVYVELLESGVDPMHIVAVTFTEKAAAEMRDRIRSAIYARIAHIPEPERGPWIRTLGLLPSAPISTIHGFCGLILREHGLNLGIDPDFSILNEQRSADLARESVVETLRTEIRSGNENIARLFGDFGLERLVESVVKAGYWLNSLGKNPDWLLDRVKDQEKAATDLKPLVVEYMNKYGGDFESIGILADELDAKKAKHPFKKRDDPSAVLPRLGQIAGVETARQLSELISLAAARFQAKKRTLNALDFDDLLLGTRDLLDRFESVRGHYQQRFAALLVDEFQDTDEVQAAIIELLAADPSGVRRFAPRKLMIVGDPKQSIYRFRRARVTVFFRTLDAILKDGGALQHLQDNRRSAAPIAAFANQLCESMLDGAGKETLSPDVDITYRIKFSAADRLIAKSEAASLGITYVSADADAKASAGREMEAEALARLLKKWRTSGVIQSWKEVAMLFRATTNMGLYIDALERHEIPVYVIQGTYFYRKTEVSDLIAALEFILRPEDPLLRATVLSSSLLGIPFQELLKLNGNCSDAANVFKPWIEMRDRATAAEILEDIVRRTNFDVVMMAQRNGPQRVANIGKLIEITRELARQGTTALDDVVRNLRDRAHDETVREPEAQIVDPDDDVVRMLTVHQAKGLEFDIVVVPDLAAKTQRNTSDRTFLSDRWGVLCGTAYGLHRKPLPHALTLVAKDEEEDQQYEEEKRLLYVAVTRARRMLVMGEGFSRHGGPWLNWVQQVLESVQPGAIDQSREGRRVKVRAKEFVVEVVPASILNVPEQLSLTADAAMVGGESVTAQLREMKHAITSRKSEPANLDLTASHLSALGECLRYFQITRIQGETEPGLDPAGSSPQMRLGSTAHKLLELGIRPSDSELASQDLTELSGVFDSAEWQALQSADPERELPFMMHIRVDGRDCWVHGRMDALVPGDPVRVIDYKYAGRREASEGGYDIQLTAYCLAAMKSLNVNRCTGELWYLKPSLNIVQREYSLSECEEHLQSLLSRYLRSLANDDWPLADRSYCDRVECGFRSRCWGEETVSVYPSFAKEGWLRHKENGPVP